MAKYWADGAVGLGDRDAGPVDLVLAGRAPDLQGGLGESEQPRRADGIGGQDAAGHVYRERSAQRGLAGLDHLPALVLGGDVVAPPATSARTS